MIVVNIIGLETHNEKSARDNQVRWGVSRISGKPIVISSAKSRRVKKQRGLAQLMVNAQTTRAQREALSQGCSCRLVRVAPRLLWDVSESCPSALAAVRDGVADALGVDDRDMATGGLVAWSYAQEKGPYGIRVELTPKAPVCLLTVNPGALIFRHGDIKTPRTMLRTRS